MRNPGLDILRCIAVVLVIFRHSTLNNILQHFGWLGVDLFFVLSGFLVSGLLFVEYKNSQVVDIKRFLIRRSFKILPPFYFFVLITVIFNLFYNNTNYDVSKLLHEVFYLQSYLPNTWQHTWSLAVEEHFYFSLAFIVLILSRKQLLDKRNLVIYSLLVFLILSLIMRVYISYPHKGQDFYSFSQTHLRSDGIIVGVLLSYLFHFTEYLKSLRYKWGYLILSLSLIAPALFYRGGGYFMNTIGLTLVNIGFGLLVFLFLSIKRNLYSSNIVKYPIQLVCFIGINSYSIYLWHLNVKSTVSLLPYNHSVINLLYILLSILAGIIFSFLIERTSLKIRDMLFPGKKSLNKF